ncbi:hypothetical protein CC99x_003595 [Candidatus Berkiella cookevillensis]|uniref:Toxin HigB-1 n=1 Tax=Candidatus Berkiella cookevillensis TaxID=437022 RepID=A0A0Q9YLZ2_9GAMM|nr:hypothetical protein [Candidatus Berkiella cookevillensis]MCS5707981.1 hypothetical protein [Candidatus Berkiella cookevillensis]
MSFELLYQPVAQSTLLDLREKAKQSSQNSRQFGLYKQINKALRLLEANPRHPGLQTHEYSSLNNPFNPKEKFFEAYAQNNTPGAYRIFWCYGPNKQQITIIAITPHP